MWSYFPDQGLNPCSPALQGRLSTTRPGKPHHSLILTIAIVMVLTDDALWIHTMCQVYDTLNTYMDNLLLYCCFPNSTVCCLQLGIGSYTDCHCNRMELIVLCGFWSYHHFMICSNFSHWFEMLKERGKHIDLGNYAMVTAMNVHATLAGWEHCCWLSFLLCGWYTSEAAVLNAVSGWGRGVRWVGEPGVLPFTL